MRISHCGVVASVALAYLFSSGSAHALTLTNTTDPMVMANAIVGGVYGVTIKSATYNGAASASATFTNGPLGIPDGILLTTGSAQLAMPPSDSGATGQSNGLGGDPRCDALIPGYTSYDAAKLTITFDLAEGFDGVSFLSIFGSEEYPEFVGSLFNDVLGVYVNGVQVVTDANGNALSINGPFFSSASVIQAPATMTEYDGSTSILQTKATISTRSARLTTIAPVS